MTTCGRTLALIAALAVVQFSLPQSASAQDKDKGGKEDKKDAKLLEVGKGLNLGDLLNDQDRKDTVRTDCFAKVYLVKMVKGRTYQIDMQSAVFDAFLRVEDMKMKQLAEDDDSGGGLNGNDAQIMFTPTADGVYRIICTTFREDTGPFNLKIVER